MVKKKTRETWKWGLFVISLWVGLGMLTTGTLSQAFDKFGLIPFVIFTLGFGCLFASISWRRFTFVGKEQTVTNLKHIVTGDLLPYGYGLFFTSPLVKERAGGEGKFKIKRMPVFLKTENYPTKLGPMMKITYSLELIIDDENTVAFEGVIGDTPEEKKKMIGETLVLRTSGNIKSNIKDRLPGECKRDSNVIKQSAEDFLRSQDIEKDFGVKLLKISFPDFDYGIEYQKILDQEAIADAIRKETRKTFLENGGKIAADGTKKPGDISWSDAHHQATVVLGVAKEHSIRGAGGRPVVELAQD